MTNQFGGAVDARLIERSPARGEERCVAGRARSRGWVEEVGRGDDDSCLRDAEGEGEREGEMRWVCSGKHGTGSDC